MGFECGAPNDCAWEDWDEVHRNALVAINGAKSSIDVKKANCCGAFKSISYGISYDGGQRVR